MLNVVSVAQFCSQHCVGNAEKGEGVTKYRCA